MPKPSLEFMYMPITGDTPELNNSPEPMRDGARGAGVKRRGATALYAVHGRWPSACSRLWLPTSLLQSFDAAGSFWSLGGVMRTTVLAIFFASAAIFARADEIDNVVTNLSDGWNDNETGVIITPQTASTDDVLQRVFDKWCFYTFEPPTNYFHITNFTVLKTREVAIPVGHFAGARAYSYTAVLVQASQGVQVVVLLRYFDVYTSRAWLSAVSEIKPPPNTALVPKP